MVIIDELAYIDKGLWDETIRALLNMKNAGLIGITTPRGPDNFVLCSSTLQTMMALPSLTCSK